MCIVVLACTSCDKLPTKNPNTSHKGRNLSSNSTESAEPIEKASGSNETRSAETSAPAPTNRIRQIPGKTLRNRLVAAVGSTGIRKDESSVGISVDEFYVSTSASPSTIATINKRLPELINCITSGLDPGRRGGKPQDVKDIEEGSPGNLVQGAVDAISNGTSRWRIVMGLGGSEDLPSHRLLAVLREPFLLAERISTLGLGTPQIRFVKANVLANRINGWDLAKMERVANITFEWICDYARHFHPVLVERLELLQDVEAVVDELIENVVIPMEKSVEPLPQIEELGKDKGANPRGSRIYALAHGFQLEAISARDASKRQQWNMSVSADLPDLVIMLGGAAERFFRRPIRIAVENAPRDRFIPNAWAHVVLQAGEKPGYFPYPDEGRIGSPLSDSQAYALADASGIIGDDWKRLLRDANRAEAIIEFLGNWRVPT